MRHPGRMAFRWLTIFLDFPADDFGPGVAFWRDMTGSTLSPFRGQAGEFATLLPSAGDACLRVQRIADGVGGCHLDLHVDTATEPLDQAAARAGALGASVRHRDDDLVIMDSPGRFTFCLVPWDGETAVPGPTGLAAAGTSRADQLCLDIPPDAFERECSFWAALTRWELRSGSRPEAAYLDRPAGMPVRLHFQRRDTAGPHDHVSAHVDFACTDRQGLAEVHAAAGARVGSVFPYWTTMADPAGRPYCLTIRDPQTGQLPAATRRLRFGPAVRPGSAGCRSAIPGQLVAEQVHQQAVMELAVAAPLVLAHDADGPEAHLGVAADGLDVGRRRVDGDPVMAALLEQELGQQPDRLGARALTLEPAGEEDIDPGMPVHRSVLLDVLDAARDLPADLHHQQHRIVAAPHVRLERRQRIRFAPPPGHRLLSQDRPQPRGITRPARPELDSPAHQHRTRPFA